MIHLKDITFAAPQPEEAGRFPFSVPTIAALAGRQLEFSTAVTVLIGENGSGKSTMLEAIACAAGSITVGSDPAEHDATLTAVRRLARTMRLSWQRRTRRGFFMRSEDFFGYAKRMRAILEEYERELRAIAADESLSDQSRGLASMPYAREVADLRRRYGEGLDFNSHGESYFKLFNSRFVPNGLYLLDEPEAPLSPMRQIGLLALLKQLVEEQGAQFIIATHSPILMAYPGAAIFSFDGGQVQPVAYDDVEHVRLMRDFLNAPARYLRHL